MEQQILQLSQRIRGTDTWLSSRNTVPPEVVMTYTVALEQITRPFHRCHQSVIDHLGGPPSVIRALHPHRDLIQAWHDLYDIRVHKGTGWGNWEALEFPSEHAYTLWLLRWS